MLIPVVSGRKRKEKGKEREAGGGGKEELKDWEWVSATVSYQVLGRSIRPNSFSLRERSEDCLLTGFSTLPPLFLLLLLGLW